MSFLPKKYQILFEQGIISLLNFSLIFVLSRLTSTTLFKDFFLGYSIVIVISLVVSNFANQPLQVFLKKKDNNRNYIFKIFLMNLLVLFIVSIICIIVVVNFYQFLASSLSYIIVLAFFTSLYDAIRRISFVYFQDNFSVNLLSSFSILFFFFVSIIYFFSINDLTLPNIYIALIISHLLGIFIFFIFKINNIKKIFSLKENSIQVSFYDILRKHNNYAIWLVIGILFFWIYTQGVYFLAEKYLIVEDFNAVRISQNLVGVLSVLFVTFENIMLVRMAITFNEKNLEGINKQVKNTIKLFLLPFIGVLIVIAVIMVFLYRIYYQDNLFYIEKIIYLLYFFIYQFIFGLSRVFVIALKAINATKYILYSHIYAAVSAVFLSVFLLSKFNNGHILGLIMITSMFVFSLRVFIFYRRVMAKRKNSLSLKL